MMITQTAKELVRSRVGLPTVLLIDDDLGTLGALRRALRNEPYDLIFTDDPYQALDWIKSREIHLIITDEFMPAMLGTELLEAVRQRSAGTGKVLLTGYPNPTVMYRGCQQKVDRMLAKPWNDDELREAARYILGARGHGIPEALLGNTLPDGDVPETPPDGAD
ncbi:MAG TPA: response regulator [Planctomycetota bacterium]|nr:response regulator [Planctomycetota bacterium]